MAIRDQLYYPPGDAARRLDVSPSGLRRYASFYEDLFGDLPKDPQGRRMWPTEAVERLEAAKALMGAGKAPSIKEALEALEAGAEPPLETLTVTLPRDVLGLLLDEMRTMSERLEALEQQTPLERLEAKLDRLQKQIDMPKPHRITVAPIDPRLEEAENMNRYLLGELERRRVEAEAAEKPRRWWPWGRR